MRCFDSCFYGNNGTTEGLASVIECGLKVSPLMFHLVANCKLPQVSTKLWNFATELRSDLAYDSTILVTVYVADRLFNTVYDISHPFLLTPPLKYLNIFVNKKKKERKEGPLFLAATI